MPAIETEEQKKYSLVSFYKTYLQKIKYKRINGRRYNKCSYSSYLLYIVSLWVVGLYRMKNIMFFFIFLFFFNFLPVVAQAYKVEVEVLGASRGCTAILRCVVPNFVKELVRVVSWIQEPAFYIYPSLQGGKFFLLFCEICVCRIYQF